MIFCLAHAQSLYGMVLGTGLSLVLRTMEQVGLVVIIWLLSSVGSALEFCSEKKFHGIDAERFLLFPGRKCSFRGIPRFTEESISKLGMEAGPIIYKN